MDKEKIVYIMGAGRSGTTILGVLLSASENYFHVGEINKFYEYKGKANGVSKGHDTFDFYSEIYNDLNIRETKTFSKIEYHSSFIKLCFNLFSSSLINKYVTQQKKLFNAIHKKTKNKFIIDSSKYGGRLLALDKYFNYDISLIYIVRHPVSYLRTVSKNSVEQPRQSFIKALIYYFFINLICKISYFNFNGKKIKVKFENLQMTPANTIKDIEGSLNLKFSISKNNLIKNKAFSTGKIFEGNRIRLKESIKFEKKSISSDNQYSLKEKIMLLINNCFYRK